MRGQRPGAGTEQGRFRRERDRGGALGTQLCQNHCPLMHVAESSASSVGGQAFSRLLGVHVTGLSTIASGGSGVHHHIPTAEPARPGVDAKGYHAD